MMEFDTDSKSLEQDAEIVAIRSIRSAIQVIDDLFNETGYAKKHPELVAAFMRVYDARVGRGEILEHVRVIARTLAEEISSLREIALRR